MNNAQEFVESVCKLLVEQPELVIVERKVDDMGVLLTIKVGEGEYGKIIGREGNIVKAIRTLARVIGIRNNERIGIKVDAPKNEDAE